MASGSKASGMESAVPGAGSPGPRPSARLLRWALFIGVLVLLDLALLGFLMFRSASERETSRALTEVRTEAEQLAREIALSVDHLGMDLFTAMATRTEIQGYIDSILSHRTIVQEVLVIDTAGNLVFRNLPPRGETGAADGERLDGLAEARARALRDGLSQTNGTERVEVPISEAGTLVVFVSRQELDQRSQDLLSDLMRLTLFIAGFTALLFGVVYALLFRMVRRTRELEDQAREAERLAYVGTLASGLAHEIRSPLNSLSLNMQMLAEYVPGGSPDAQSSLPKEALAEPVRRDSVNRLLSITRSEISRLEGLVTDFLAYARPSRPELVTVRAVELMEHLSEVLRGRIRADEVAYVLEDESAGAAVEVDRAQLNQLLLNLVDNALAATERVENPVIRLRVDCQGDWVRLCVGDNGVGMSPEHQEQMFDLFFSQRKGGTGLGLAIVDRIARAHRGRVEVDSAPGRGTTIRLLLPRAAAEDIEFSAGKTLRLRRVRT